MIPSKKILLAVALLVGTASAQFEANSSVQPLPHQNSEMAQQNRTITSEATYNSLDHGGMAAGMLSKPMYPVMLNFGFAGQGLASEGDSVKGSNGLFSLPVVTIGTPEQIAFRAYYGLTPLKFTNEPNDSTTLSMPFHRLGINFASQREDKVFRFGLNFDMFVGKVGYEETSDSGRAVLGAEKIGFTFGSTPHELISFDLGISASGYIDSLFGTEKDAEGEMYRQERIAEIVLPNAELAVNFGSPEYPVLSSFSFNYARKNYVYAVRNGGLWAYGISNEPEENQPPNADPIVTDSIGWNWKNRIHIEAVPEKLKVNPSFELGYWHNRYKRMRPGADNHPFSSKYKGEATGYRWETSSFKFGFGLDFELFNFVDYWIEYGHANVKLDMTGDADIYKTHENKEDGFNRFATGFELGFHNIPSIGYSESGELFFSASFLHLQETGLNNSYYGSSQYEHFNEITTDTQAWKYTPWNGIEHRVRTNDFTLGLRATFSNNTIETVARIHFLDQIHFGTMDDLTGNRFQFDIIYNLTEK